MAKVTRRRYATLLEAAEYVGCDERTIRREIAKGRLTGYRLSQRVVRVDLDQIDTLMTPSLGGAA